MGRARHSFKRSRPAGPVRRYRRGVTDAASRPDLALTLGDPTGIGPEITLAALADAPVPLRRRCRVFGHRAALVAAVASLARTRARAELEQLVDELVLHEPALPWSALVPGQPGPASGAAALAYLDDAIAAAGRGEVAGLVTAPLSKRWAKAAGLAFLGHTELLASRLGAAEVVMMFVGPRLRVALATTHLPLAAVPAALADGRLARVIELTAAALVTDLGLARPRLGVVGLNPHAGEGGLLGPEEAALIAPAIAAAQAVVGPVTLTGPLVPDVAFRDHAEGRYDGLVAMYHDQGLIPVKLLDFDDAVNVTLGLPIVRTSPDHGTAFDLAGQGQARSRSMQQALQLAAALVDRRAAAAAAGSAAR
jgi:4-hydroxythreonine-4-phosphate dehydrogenase